jgi:hypothetical protein
MWAGSTLRDDVMMERERERRDVGPMAAAHIIS